MHLHDNPEPCASPLSLFFPVIDAITGKIRIFAARTTLPRRLSP
jgi:hypothetical protein